MKNYDELLHSNVTLNAIAVSLLKQGLTINASTQEFYLHFLLTKGRKTHQAIIILAEQRFGQDAAILCRSLFEMMITSLYIFKEDADKRLGRFLSHGWITKKERFKYFLSRDELKTLFEERQAEQRDGDQCQTDIESYAQNAEEEFGYNGSFVWSEKSIKGMSEESGRLPAYETVYRIMCDLAHTNVASMNEYVTIPSPGEAIFKWEEGTDWVQESLVASFDFFLAITSLYNSELHKGIDESLSEITEKYLNVVEKEDSSPHA